MDQLLIFTNDRIAAMHREVEADRLAQAAAQQHRSSPRALRRTLQLLSTRLSNGRAGPTEHSPPAPRPAA
jgi:hypothetical protein